jgi:predicted nucleic acid-binding protein
MHSDKKEPQDKVKDARIAATATINDLILVTRNTSDFDPIENLDLINPHKIK